MSFLKLKTPNLFTLLPADGATISSHRHYTALKLYTICTAVTAIHQHTFIRKVEKKLIYCDTFNVKWKKGCFFFWKKKWFFFYMKLRIISSYLCLCFDLFFSLVEWIQTMFFLNSLLIPAAAEGKPVDSELVPLLHGLDGSAKYELIWTDVGKSVNIFAFKLTESWQVNN